MLTLFALISVTSSSPQEDDKDAPRMSDKDVKYLTCEEETKSRYQDGEFVGNVPEYDLYEVLLSYGGPPGEVNATWVEVSSSDEERRFAYDFGDTDYKSWIRLESGGRSNPGTRIEKQYANGTVYWMPSDFCGWLRKAEYSLRDGEFTFKVEYGTKCMLEAAENGEISGDSTLGCTPVPHCTSDGCVAGASAGLLAALVGGSG